MGCRHCSQTVAPAAAWEPPRRRGTSEWGCRHCSRTVAPCGAFRRFRRPRGSDWTDWTCGFSALRFPSLCRLTVVHACFNVIVFLAVHPRCIDSDVSDDVASVFRCLLSASQLAISVGRVVTALPQHRELRFICCRPCRFRGVPDLHDFRTRRFSAQYEMK